MQIYRTPLLPHYFFVCLLFVTNNPKNKIWRKSGKLIWLPQNPPDLWQEPQNPTLVLHITTKLPTGGSKHALVGRAAARAHWPLRAPSSAALPLSHCLLPPAQGCHSHIYTEDWLQATHPRFNPHCWQETLLPSLTHSALCPKILRAEDLLFLHCTFLFLYSRSTENLSADYQKKNTPKQSAKGTYFWLVCCSLNQINGIHRESICLLFVPGKKIRVVTLTSPNGKRWISSGWQWKCLINTCWLKFPSLHTHYSPY